MTTNREEARPMAETEGPSVSVREQVELVRRVVRKRWWLIALVAVAAGVAAFGTAKMLSPVYEASTTVRILRERGVADAMERQSSPYGRTLQAEATWFTSRQVLEPVIQRLALADSPAASVFEAATTRVKKAFRRLLRRPAREDARYYEILDQLRGKAIKVKELEGSHVLEIRVNWHDPEMTMRIANTVVDVFIEQFQAFNRGRSRQSRTYLEQQVQLMRTQLDESEKQLVEFQKKTGFVAPDDRLGGLPFQADLQRITVEKRQLQMQLASANAELEQIDKRVANQDPGKPESNQALRAALRNPNSLLRALMNQAVAMGTAAAGGNSLASSRASKGLVGLKERIAKELEHLGADATLSPDDLLLMVQEEEQKTGVSENVAAQLQVERESLAARIKVCQDQLTRLEAESAQAETETQKLPDELQQYLSLIREKRVNEELYTMLCQRLAGAQVDENSDLCDIRVFDLAQLPVQPLKPKPGLLAAIGTFMGLLLGICVAFSVEYLDDSLHTSQEVLSYLGLPVLAEIPRVKVKMRKRLASVGRTPELVDHT